MKKTKKRRNKSQFYVVLRIFICIFAVGLTLFGYIEKQNELTELRLAIPALAKEVKGLQEENTRLTFEIEQFESPINLMEILRQPEFNHLKYPFIPDQVFLPKAEPLKR